MLLDTIIFKTGVLIVDGLAEQEWITSLPWERERQRLLDHAPTATPTTAGCCSGHGQGREPSYREPRDTPNREPLHT